MMMMSSSSSRRNSSNNGSSSSSNRRKRQNSDTNDSTGIDLTNVAGDKEEIFPWRYGSIKGVFLSDFLTYHQNVKVDFGTRVNLILGPNVNGKSSIVCAIMLGLGGSPGPLDRGDNLLSFIRNKEAHDETDVKQATIMVELVGSKIDGVYRRIFIKRVISRDAREKSIFFLNENAYKELNWRDEYPKREKEREHTYVNADTTKTQVLMRRVPKAHVTRLVKDVFKIELDNVCQFLPQQAVREFTNASNKQLLLRTVKSIHCSRDHAITESNVANLQTGVPESNY